MKALALFLSVAILTATKLYSQEGKYDVIEYYEVFVNQVPMVSKKAVVIRKIGKPDSIKRVEGIEDIYWFDYYYKRSSIQIDPEGDFMGFNISDSFFTLTFKSTKIKIGQSANDLKKLFPKSYKHYTTTKTKYFRIKIKDNDSYILFTIKSNVITQVHTWDDNT
jgi:hypothetical protein